ncbi:DNA topoisomerase 2-binding protein 1 [Quillaja saponaria]|nr:DNA topoisomerase 2-binding protein 1 [Quillaja saponaria]
MQSAACSSVADSDLPVCCNKFVDRDQEATDSQNFSSAFSNAPVSVTKADSEAHIVQLNNEVNLDSTVASDSQSDDSDLYLSECRILLVGFEASQMRRLVNMVRRGGGSRYMSFNDKLTHIVIGIPSEMEKKDVRSLAAMGVIHVVRTSWLEDCDREKKEVPILRRHVASDLLLPKGALTGLMGLNQGKNSTIHQSMLADQVLGSKDSVIGTPSSLDSNIEGKPEIGVNRQISSKAVGRSTVQSQLPIVNNKVKDQEKMQHDSSVQNESSSTAFRGKRFRFSNSFPEDRRAEVAQWVYQGRGEVVDDHSEQNVHFTIACHGMKPSSADVLWSTSVSSHWIRSCLEDGSLLDINSHILYSPLPCHIPLPGFENFRFCVSQYEDKDRVLLRNLCFVLGAKFVEKLNKKVTHLLCKFTSGPKYEAACKWGIHSITSEWMFECVKQNRIVALDPFLPKEVTAQDQEAGFCTVSQFPTQAVRMIGADSPSQFHSQSENLKNTPVYKVHRESEKFRDETKISSKCSKKARIFEDHGLNSGYPMCDMNPTEDNILKDTGETSEAFPDVAAAIEDLLEQTSKIHSQKSPSRTECDRSLFSSEFSILGEDHSNAHSVTGLSKHWLNRRGRKDDECNVSGDGNGDVFYGFSETQTDSQVVGYEEDLSGRQMLIEKIRTRNSMT